MIATSPFSKIMEKDSILIGSAILKSRTSARLTQDQLSIRSHLAPSVISEIENGKYAVKLEQVSAIAYALDLDLLSLVEIAFGSDSSNPSP
jgi:transcriptional regulator with XRE-family HTH domain